jgi:ABC-type oligopeptide transport system substrate-binding subunit
MKKSSLLLFILLLSLLTVMMAGCISETTETKNDKEIRPNMVEEISLKVENKEKLVTQVGFLNGFPEKDLVEFKVQKDNKETLRIFKMGTEISKYLAEEKQDGKTEFTLTYEESTDGITTPNLIKIEKK